MFPVSTIKNFIGTSRSIEDNLLQSGKLYQASNENYTAIVVLIEVNEDVQIAMIYGNFDHNVLGNSFNVPNGTEVDMNLKQMTVYKNDEFGSNYFALPDSPPKCDEFNYLMMTMNVNQGKFVLKPKNWNSEQKFYDFDVSKMKPLDMSMISSPNEWCKAKDLQKTKKETSFVEVFKWIGFGVAILILVLLLVFWIFSTSSLAGAW